MQSSRSQVRAFEFVCGEKIFSSGCGLESVDTILEAHFH
jgi:hypothetical protein